MNRGCEDASRPGHERHFRITTDIVKPKPAHKLIVPFLLAFVLLASGYAGARHDCSHLADGHRHDCALCWLSFSSAEDTPALHVSPDNTVVWFATNFGSQTGSFHFPSPRDSRAPPAQ